MYKVFIDIDKKVDLKKFQNGIQVGSKPKYVKDKKDKDTMIYNPDIEVAKVLRENNIKYTNTAFNTGSHHKKLDFTTQVAKYDTVWLNEEKIVAFWSHRNDILYF